MKGIILSWIDAVNDGNVTTFRAVGRPGGTYTPERDLWLYANWKTETGSEAEQEPETESEEEPEQKADISYEARIGY